MIAAPPPGSAAHRAARGIHRAFVAALLSCLALAGVLVGEPSTAWAEDIIGISGVPADAEGKPDGRSRFSYSADPGQQVADNYLVRNTGTLAQSFTILATDAFNDDAGAFGLLDTGAEATDIGTWVHFENGANRLQFDLKPGESRVVPFTVDIPAQAGPGDHAGGILASVVTPGEQVNVDRRLGTRLYVRVSGDIQAGLTIGGIESQYVGDWWNPFTGAVRMSYTVENTGNIALASNVSLGVRTWFGVAAAGQAGDGIPELLPGSARTFETTVPGVASWGYLNPWVTLNPFVEGDDASKRMPMAATTRDTMLIATPWVLVIAIVLAALIYLFGRWRRQADAKRAAVWIEYTENEARRKAEADQAAVQAVEQAPEQEEVVVGGGATTGGSGT